MELSKFRKKLGRYLKSNSNETETAIVEAWYKTYQNEEASAISDARREAIRRSIQVSISSVIDKPAQSYKIIYRIAASIVLISVAGALGFLKLRQPAPAQQVTYTSYQTQQGQVKQFKLADGSVIWLNAGSKIRIPSTFHTRIRRVYLEEGEAFFDIKHNPQKPFQVNTRYLRVQVLGTSFNVSAYKDLSKQKVTVLTGKVGVCRGSKLLRFLLPGQELDYEFQKHKYAVKAVNASETQSWKDGDTYLHAAGFSELALVFKNLYGLSLKAGSKKVDSYVFTVRLKRDLPATETLELICSLRNTHFRKEGNQVLIY